MSLTAYERTKEWRKSHPGARTEEARRRRAKYPEKGLAAAKRWYAKDPERARALGAAAARARRARDPEGQRRRIAKFKAKFEAERVRIAGRPRPDLCEICNEFNLRIVFDHCHLGGYFRGWICDRCNKVLGTVKDSPKLLRDLADYLEKTNGETNVEAEKCTTR